jgi:hypothetical protein
MHRDRNAVQSTAMTHMLLGSILGGLPSPALRNRITHIVRREGFLFDFTQTEHPLLLLESNRTDIAGPSRFKR